MGGVISTSSKRWQSKTECVLETWKCDWKLWKRNWWMYVTTLGALVPHQKFFTRGITWKYSNEPYDSVEGAPYSRINRVIRVQQRDSYILWTAWCSRFLNAVNDNHCERIPLLADLCMKIGVIKQTVNVKIVNAYESGDCLATQTVALCLNQSIFNRNWDFYVDVCVARVMHAFLCLILVLLVWDRKHWII